MKHLQTEGRVRTQKSENMDQGNLEWMAGSLNNSCEVNTHKFKAIPVTRTVFSAATSGTQVEAWNSQSRSNQGCGLAQRSSKWGTNTLVGIEA